MTNRRDLLRGLAGAALAEGFVAPTAVQASMAGPGASELYREAAGKLPARSEAEDKFLADVATAPLGREAAEYAERAAPGLALLIRGASAGSCDWGNFWLEDFFDRLFQVGFGLKRLAILASLRGRIAIHGGRHGAGIADGISALTLGRHLARGGVLIVQYLGLTIEHAAITALAASLPRLGREELQSLESRLAGLPAMLDAAAMVRAERTWYRVFYAPANPIEQTPVKVERWSAWTARLADVCTAPAALAAIRAEAKPESDEAEFLENFDGYLRARTYADMKSAVLRAAIAIARDGAGSVARVPDPTDGRPFTLRSWATGFELLSRFALPGKPTATLLVGSR